MTKAWLICCMYLAAGESTPAGPGRSFISTDRLVNAAVFHWYTSTEGQLSGPWQPVEGRSQWTGEPAFWVRQIKDMMDANLDVMHVHLMPAFEQQRINLFTALCQLRMQGYDVPKICPFLDPLITWDGHPIDLATTAGKDEFVAQYTRFFNQYFGANPDIDAESYLLHINNKVALNTWHCNAGYTNNTASLTRSDVESRLAAAFGAAYPTFNNGIYMFATPNGTPPSFYDELMHQFSINAYYGKSTAKSRKTVGLKPGYWDQNIRKPGMFLPRDGGSRYASAWAQLNNVKNGGINVDGESNALPIYHAQSESWNEYDEGSGIYAGNPGPPYIDPFNTSGHTDTWSSTSNPRQYIDTTALYAAQFTARPQQDVRFLAHTLPAVIYAGTVVPASITVRNEGYAQWTAAAGYRLGLQGPTLQRWTFDADAEGWGLVPNAFGTSGNTAYEHGDWNISYAFSGGGLRTRTGNVDNLTYTSGASTAWARTFHLDSTRNVGISFKWRMVFPGSFESDEYGEARFDLNGQLHGLNGQSYLARCSGGTGAQDTGWQDYFTVVSLSGPADHTLKIGGWNNRKSAIDEFVDVYVDDVMLVDVDASPGLAPGRFLMDDAADEIPTYGGIFRGRPKTFDFQLTAPAVHGVYDLHFQMVQENVAWFGPRLDVRVQVSIRADFDDDGDVDQDDFGMLQTCLRASRQPIASGCTRADLADDGDVDGDDLALFRACMGGADHPPGC